ncbi:MAG TPA: hypothetical protein VNA69_08730 [Thermoanaerobaculia bacterium]|nr:hypothetical protein [Thermoanaerobaculia bacterium]
MAALLPAEKERLCDPGQVIRELLLKLIAFPAAGCLVLFVASCTASITSPSKAIEPSTRGVQLVFAIGLGSGAVWLSAACLRRPLGAVRRNRLQGRRNRLQMRRNRLQGKKFLLTANKKRFEGKRFWFEGKQIWFEGRQIWFEGKRFWFARR